MNERTVNGVLLDEYNGQPITAAHDVIIHHKQPLTMQNVNDYSVSLNPANLMIVSHKSHNEIHSRFGFKMNKKIYYVYGAPCSGKTTFVQRVKGNSDFVIDIDLIWFSITGGRKYEKPDALKPIVFSVRDCLFDKAKTRSGNFERCYIIEGGANKAERERRISAIGCEPIFIQSTREDCIKHLFADDERKDVREQWIKYIDAWFACYTE
jgi:ribosomal protein L24